MRFQINEPFNFSLLEILPVGVFFTDVQGHCLFANKYLCEMLGLDMASFLDDGWIQYLHPNDKQFVTVNWYAAIKLCLPFTMEFRYASVKGKLIWAYCQTTSVLNELGKVKGYIGVITDITKQKNLKNRSQHSNNAKEYFELGLESAKTGVWSWEIASNSLTWDKRVYKLFGVPPTKILLSYEDFLIHIHPDDLARVKKTVNSTLIYHSAKTANYSTEFRIVLPNNKVRHIRAVGRAYFDRNNNPTLMTGVCRDVTKQKEKDYQLHQQQTELTQHARQQAVGEMASSLAHELNQPLTAIAIYAQLCVKQMLPGNLVTPEQADALDYIAKQSERAGNIIHRVKNFARQQSLYYEPANIRPLIDEAIELLAYEKVGKLPELVIEVAADLPILYLDRTQIQQVLINLIKNSIEALQAVSELTKQIKICAFLTKDNKIAITIIDNGLVIPKSLQARVFDPYFTTKKTGLGIGLAICRSIIEAHRGHLRLCYSNKKRGTCFKFTLPLSD